MMDDQTSIIPAVHHVEDSNEKTWLPTGVYAKVYGQVRTRDGRKYINIFKISKISDLNEITCHALEVLLVSQRIAHLRDQELNPNSTTLEYVRYTKSHHRRVLDLFKLI